ncbi:hypothetical protein ASP35_21825 [Salmonella enterica subsp. enterica serovar Dublin]|nr:hypothetical protein [Salmonella enterica subsp. enterica serovar Dublin]
MTTIYVTKYALSSGLFKTDAVLKHDGTFAFWHSNGWSQCASGKDFWLTEAEALADCERRRAAKLASIEKQRKKLEAMNFSFKD